MDPIKNFAEATLVAGIAAGDTAAAVGAGEAGDLPTGGQWLGVIWNFSDFGNDRVAAYKGGQAEVVGATRTGVNLALVRAQDGTIARDFNVGGKVYKIAQDLTAGLFSKLAPKSNATFTETTTVENLVITKGVTIAPAPMAALAIDIKEQRNTKSLSTNSTLSFSATPSSGDTFGAILTETGGSEITVGIPECYSSNRGGLITDFVLAGNAVVELGFWHDGARLNISGDPRTQAQERTALGLGDSATRNVGTASGTVAAGDHAHTAASVTDFAAASRAQVEATIVAGSNITITPGGTGATRTLTIASSGGGGGGGGGTFSIDDGDATADPATIGSFDDGDATTA